MPWPANADGDVFRRLEASGFNFDAEHVVDYNVDFESWPPPQAALAVLRENYPNAQVQEPEGGLGGYALFQELGHLSCLRVIEVQEIVTAAMHPYGGVCESWCVMQEAPAKP
jgi:hypothetical protein